MWVVVVVVGAAVAVTIFHLPPPPFTFTYFMVLDTLSFADVWFRADNKNPKNNCLLLCV